MGGDDLPHHLQFEEESGITVEIEQHAFDQVIQKTTADFVGQTGFYDAILNPHVRLPTLIANQWVQPINKFLADPELADPEFQLEEAVLNRDWLYASLGQDGELYGVPFSSHTIYLNWRQDLFDDSEEQQAFKAKYGYDLPSPPVTMQQMWDTAEFFTWKAGDTLAGETLEQDIYGMTLSGKRHISMLWNFYNGLRLWPYCHQSLLRFTPRPARRNGMLRGTRSGTPPGLEG